MDIVFEDKQFALLCNNLRLLERKNGRQRAKLIQQRLNALLAAEVLEDMRHVPGKCHELRHNRAGQFAMNLDGPYRLVFEPANEPFPTRPDGGIDWNKVTAVRILGVEDYHE